MAVHKTVLCAVPVRTSAARRLGGEFQRVLGIEQDAGFHDAEQQGEEDRRDEGEFDGRRSARGMTRSGGEERAIS